MSIETLAVCLHHSKASGTDKLVLLGIANHDGDGGAWPAIATLAKYANTTDRTVSRSIRRLRDLGEIEAVLNGGGLPQQRNDLRPNLYRVLVACPATCDGSVHHRERDDKSGNGMTNRAERDDILGINGMTNLVERDDTDVILTIHKPSIEPSLEVAQNLANQLAARIEANGSKKPAVTNQWITEINRMIQIDKRSPQEISDMIDWSQSDSFWRSNILSPKKLRAKFDQMRLQRESRKPSGGFSYFQLANLETRKELEK